ncbi:manganese efflux pump [Candidatus Latescibacterota bacterium]
MAPIAGRHVFRLAFHFGLFQALMPTLGWVAGMGIHRHIAAFDHWVAFGLLGFVGGRMAWGSLRPGNESVLPRLRTGRSQWCQSSGPSSAFGWVQIQFFMASASGGRTGRGRRAGRGRGRSGRCPAGRRRSARSGATRGPRSGDRDCRR